MNGCAVGIDVSKLKLDWREAHIGFSNSGLRLMGIEGWKSEWRALPWPPLRLPHPAHRQQIHRYDVYEIGPPERPVRFAAAELSNGVWGFYVPTPPPTDAGESADGSLGFRRHGGLQVHGRDDSSESWFVITDVANGQVLVDCKAWEWSEVTGRADGGLFLHLRSNGFDALFRIVPQTRCLSNFGEAGPDLPLSALAGVVEQARLVTCRSDRVPSYRRISTDGSSRVDLLSVEWSNSHWVNSPRVIEIASGRVVLDLWNTDWDATVSVLEGSMVRLDMIRYRQGGNASLNSTSPQTRFASIVSDEVEAPIDRVAWNQWPARSRIFPFRALKNRYRSGRRKRRQARKPLPRRSSLGASLR